MDPETFESVSDVHVWWRGMPMRSTRSLFVCAEAGGKIYVASSHDKLKKAFKMAEASDAVADGWDPLPDMSEERYECYDMTTHRLERVPRRRRRTWWCVAGCGAPTVIAANTARSSSATASSSGEKTGAASQVWRCVLPFLGYQVRPG
ncbi:hypothetical protein ACQ4PT_034663 [Festuca glaucescens]